MELTDKETRLLAHLSRSRGLYAECKGGDLDALQELGLLQWFDARSSTTPFKQDPRPLLRLHGISGRIDYFWIAPVENWRELVGPEVAAKVDAIDEIGWAVKSGPFTRTVGRRVARGHRRCTQRLFLERGFGVVSGCAR
jgi:hypothetical protein